MSARTTPPGPRREDRGYGRPDRQAVPPPPRGSSEPWSDVPPELEAMLRAQVAQKPAPAAKPHVTDDRPSVSAPAAASAPGARAARKPSTRTTRLTSSPPAVASEGATVAGLASEDKAPLKRRATRVPKALVVDVGAPPAISEPAAVPAPRPKAARKPAAGKAARPAVAASPDADGAAAPPKRRGARKSTTAESA